MGKVPNLQHITSMKSAYELALARMGLGKDEPTRTLSDAQRAEISDIDRRFAAKIAEREIFIKQDIDRARAAGDREGAERAQEALRAERAALEEERELAKEQIRQG